MPAVMLSHDKSMFMFFFLSQKSLVQSRKNMKPENGPLEEEILIGNHHFQGSMSSMVPFGGARGSQRELVMFNIGWPWDMNT